MGYLVEKKFTIPVGHRLSKHLKRCKNYHGHNFQLYVGVSSNTLNDNDMVIDFSDLKTIVNPIIDKWDHTLLLNKNDPIYNNNDLANEFRIIAFDFDPTAEKMAEILFKVLKLKLNESNVYLKLEYVTVFENENSKVTYRE